MMHGDTRFRIGSRATGGRRVWFPIVNQRLTSRVVRVLVLSSGTRASSPLGRGRRSKDAIPEACS
jgi:hypothetical protein